MKKNIDDDSSSNDSETECDIVPAPNRISICDNDVSQILTTDYKDDKFKAEVQAKEEKTEEMQTPHSHQVTSETLETNNDSVIIIDGEEETTALKEHTTPKESMESKERATKSDEAVRDTEGSGSENKDNVINLN